MLVVILIGWLMCMCFNWIFLKFVLIYMVFSGIIDISGLLGDMCWLICIECFVM